MRDAGEGEKAGGPLTREAPKSKHQDPNNIQIANFKFRRSVTLSDF
jgi:hypothetical protein